MYNVKGKGGRPDRKPHLLPYFLRNPYRNLKSENSQDNAQKPERNYTFMNSASGKKLRRGQGWFVIRTEDREQSYRGPKGQVDNDGVYFQADPLVQDSWDAARKITCDWQSKLGRTHAHWTLDSQ